MLAKTKWLVREAAALVVCAGAAGGVAKGMRVTAPALLVRNRFGT